MLELIALDGLFIHQRGRSKSDLYLGCILYHALLRKDSFGFSPLVGFPSKYWCLLFFAHLDIDLVMYDLYKFVIHALIMFHLWK